MNTVTFTLKVPKGVKPGDTIVTTLSQAEVLSDRVVSAFRIREYKRMAPKVLDISRGLGAVVTIMHQRAEEVEGLS